MSHPSEGLRNLSFPIEQVLPVVNDAVGTKKSLSEMFWSGLFSAV
jgi:hypothetical protein